jgi:branched-chain amino acid aminotransferase
MDIAREKGIPVEEKMFTMYDVYTADEVFLTGTAAEVIPVINVDSRIITDGKPGKMTRELIAAFHELTKVDGPLITLQRVLQKNNIILLI